MALVISKETFWSVDILNIKLQGKFGDTKVVIRSRKSKDRQRNGQKKNDKGTHNDLQN